MRKNRRADPKGSGGEDQGHGEGDPGNPHAGRTGDLLGGTPHQKANGYYTRDLLTLIGPLEDLRVPRVREGDFHPKILPYRRPTSLELSEAVLALYAAGVSTRKIARFLEKCMECSTHPRASPDSPRL